jgi:hypothetical protein
MTVIDLSASMARAAFRSESFSFGGRPPLRPRALAASSPARVCSRMIERSNSARAPKTWKNRARELEKAIRVHKAQEARRRAAERRRLDRDKDRGGPER